MDETIYVILKVLFDFALEVWFSIVKRLAKALIRLCICAGCAENMLVAHTQNADRPIA